MNAEIEYSLLADSGGHFRMDASEGIVRVARALDRETLGTHTAVVHAKDAGTPVLTATATLAIRVIGEN